MTPSLIPKSDSVRRTSFKNRYACTGLVVLGTSQADCKPVVVDATADYDEHDFKAQTASL